MSLNVGATAGPGQRHFRPDPRNIDRPFDASLAELSRQLAARFEKDPATTAVAGPVSTREIKGLSRGKKPVHVEERDPRVRPLTLALMFFTGAVVAAALGSLYLFHQPGVMLALSGSSATAPESFPREIASTLPLPPPPPAIVDPAPAVQARETGLAARPGLQPMAATQTSASDDVALGYDDIREGQALLKSAGFDPGPVDGISGPLTGAAVRRYQESRGLMPSGTLDRQLLKRLRQDREQPVAPVHAGRPTEP